MPVDLRVLAPAFRSARWARAAIAVLALALVGNIVFAFLTTRHGAWHSLRDASPAFLALAVALAWIPFVTNASRIYIWARFMGATIRFRDAFRIAVTSDLGSSIAPTAAGSGAVRLTMLRQHGLSTGRASALIAMTVIEDATFFAVFLPLGYAFSSHALVSAMPGALMQVVQRAGLVLAGAVLVGIALSAIGGRLAGRKEYAGRSRVRTFLQRVRGWGHDARGALGEVLRRGKLRAACTLTLSAIQWSCRYSVVAAIFAAFGLPAFPLTHVVLQWVVFTAGTIVPTPGGAATMETAFALVYHPLLPDALLGPVTATWRFLLFYLMIAFDVTYLALVALNRRPTSTTAENEVSSSPAM